MATPYIGSYFFDAFEGAPSVAGVVLEDISRPGVDGVAYRKVGYRGDPFPVRTLVAVATETDAFNLMTEYRQLIGTVQTLTDPNDRDWANCLVLHARPGFPQKFQGGIGGVSSLSSGYLLQCEWMLQLTGV